MTTGRAVVIGAGIAGLLAAGVLAGQFGSVVVVDRDDLDDEALPRAGVPQGRHTHLLLPGGLAALELLQPGVTEALLSRGGRRGDLQERVVMCVGPNRLAPGTCSADFVSTSRGIVESSLRRFVGHQPGVEFRTATSVLDLTFTSDERRVTGIRLAARDGGPTEELSAALVVDASGRSSRTPEWLGRRGYAAPEESQVRVDERYVTRVFRQPAEHDEGVLVIAQGGSVENPRSGIAAHQYGDVWSVSLSGYHGDQPARDLPGFRDFARSLDASYLATFLETAQPLDEGASYRFVSNTRRHYERLERFPGGLIVLGDAVCSLDPVKGQGMSLAALQAKILAGCLSQGTGRLARRFFPAVAALLGEPWAMAIAPELDRPGSGLHRNPLEAGFERYLGALLRGAVHDPILAGAFLRTAALVAPASTLLNPRTVARVLLGETARLRPRHTVSVAARLAASVTDRPPHDAVSPTEESPR